MNTETWNVSIALADDGFEVTAKARFADCGVDLVGLGVVPIELGEHPGLQAQALAAVRSLRSLADALDQVAGADRSRRDGRVR